MRNNKNALLGTVLILIGIYFLLEILLPLPDGTFFLLLGLSFMAAFFLRNRNRGFAYAASILTMMGAIQMLFDLFAPSWVDGIVPLALGVGLGMFVSLALVGWQEGRWAVAPGIALTGVALFFLLMGNPMWRAWLEGNRMAFIAIALIVVGIVVVISALVGRRRN